MFETVNIATAFLAGLLSFFSPCTLPLVPLFLGHLVGATGRDGAGAVAAARGSLLRNAAAFVLGFTLVFVVLFGLSAGLLARALVGQRAALLQVGGVFLIALGLNYLGVIRIPALLRDWRITWRPARRGAGRGHWPTSLLVGALFALGWTPCIGAILGTITVLGMLGEGVGQAVLLLTVYSLGLGLPFMVVAAGFGRATVALRRVHRHLPALERLSGVLIVTVGILMITGAYQGFFVRLIRLVPWTPPF